MGTIEADSQEPQLVERQHVFAGNIARLILHAIGLGYQVAGGEWWRSYYEAQRLEGLGLGTATSLHCERLAFDLILRRDGKWLRFTEDYAALGAYWKGLDKLNRWGGDFIRKDGNHFSMEYQGRK